MVELLVNHVNFEVNSEQSINILAFYFRFPKNTISYFIFFFSFLHFVVDASQAGEGQLEISINEGEVPNHVQVVGGGRCLVSFTPEIAKPHYIDIKFNGETVTNCPFVCSIADTSRVSLNLANLGKT